MYYIYKFIFLFCFGIWTQGPSRGLQAFFLQPSSQDLYCIKYIRSIQGVCLQNLINYAKNASLWLMLPWGWKFSGEMFAEPVRVLGCRQKPLYLAYDCVLQGKLSQGKWQTMGFTWSPNIKIPGSTHQSVHLFIYIHAYSFWCWLLTF